MTEIPEYLLKRSKAAKGSSGKDDSAASETSASTAVESAASGSSVPAPSGPPAIAAAAASIGPDKAPEPAAPEARFVTAAKAREKVPMWALPLVLALPLWAYFFAGTMQQPHVEDPLFVDAAEVYSVGGGCSGCHGATGSGGIGYRLDEGSVVEVFPNPIDQIVHVARGSAAISGESYGSERAEGQRTAGATGSNMPAFSSTLSLLEIELVVFHERAVLSDEDTSSASYQEWISELRERIEAGHDEHVDLDFLLACANPAFTPGATGAAIGGEEPCPGPIAEAGEIASN